MEGSKEIDPDLAAIRLEVETLKRDLDRKNEIIEQLLQRLYGKKSERYDPNQLVFNFDEECLGKAEPIGSGEENDSDGNTDDQDDAKPKKNRSKKRDLLPRNIAVIVTDTIIPQEVQADPDAYEQISEEYHDELEVQSEHLYYNRVVMPKYRLKEGKAKPPVIAPAPEPTVPGTKCGAKIIAMILADKYCDHLPHYRQSDRFLRRHGAIICRQTINKWTHSAAALLAPIYEAIRKDIMRAELLQIDETPIEYLVPGLGKTAKGYFWVYRNHETGTQYFDWQLGRGHECMFDILGYESETRTLAFTGKIQCDGYSAYTALEKLIERLKLAGCLAHIRRKFYEARKLAPDLVDEILRLIQILYRYEKPLRRKGHPPPADCRLLVRKGHEQQYVDQLKSLIDDEKDNYLPKSSLGEAFTYACNQWGSLKAYLEDGRLEIDNNLIENAIRPSKLGMKNYLFIGNAKAGDSSALLYTLIANCKVVGIDPERYLATVLERVSLATTTEEAELLTPAMLADEVKANQPVPLKYENPQLAHAG